MAYKNPIISSKIYFLLKEKHVDAVSAAVNATHMLLQNLLHSSHKNSPQNEYTTTPTFLEVNSKTLSLVRRKSKENITEKKLK